MNLNQPSGIYGATTQSFQPTLGGGGWSPSAIWVAPNGLLGAPVGSGEYDIFGRHNSLYSAAGWSTYWWTTFGGYEPPAPATPGNTMQTATFADTF